MDEEELYERVRRTVAAIPDGHRCEEELYQRRLACCRECDRLLSGVCGVCGCFVEVRAAKRGEHCPAPEKKFW